MKTTYKPGMRFERLEQVSAVCRTLVEASGRGPREVCTFRLYCVLFDRVDGEYRMRADVSIPDALRECARTA